MYHYLPKIEFTKLFSQNQIPPITVCFGQQAFPSIDKNIALWKRYTVGEKLRFFKSIRRLEPIQNLDS